MFETYREERKEYAVLLPHFAIYQRLFKFKFQENVKNPKLLSKLIGLADQNDLAKYVRKLEAWFSSVMGGEVRADWLGMVCPECLTVSLTDYGGDGEEIKKTCIVCGAEVSDSVSDIDDFDQSLDRDVTYAPTSHISWTKGQGCTFDQKKELHKLLNDSSVRFSDFKVSSPDIAEALAEGFEFVVTESGFVYRRMGDFVRRVTVSEFYGSVDALFHSFDIPLRKKKAMLASAVQSDLKHALEYGLQLCNKYGYDRNDKDQALFNTVGREITLMKHQLKAQRRYVPEKRIVETMFYICLLLFGKKGVATRVLSELDVDYGLVNYYDDYKEFLFAHDKDDGSRMLVKALEQTA